jgi:hypothetical protein
MSTPVKTVSDDEASAYTVRKTQVQHVPAAGRSAPDGFGERGKTGVVVHENWHTEPLAQKLRNSAKSA